MKPVATPWPPREEKKSMTLPKRLRSRKFWVFIVTQAMLILETLKEALDAKGFAILSVASGGLYTLAQGLSDMGKAKTEDH